MNVMINGMNSSGDYSILMSENRSLLLGFNVFHYQDVMSLYKGRRMIPLLRQRVVMDRGLCFGNEVVV